MKVPVSASGSKPEAIPMKNALGCVAQDEKHPDEVALQTYLREKSAQRRQPMGKKAKKRMISQMGGSMGRSGLPKEVDLWPRNRGLTLAFRVGTAVAAGAASGQIQVGDVFGAIGVVGRVTNTSVTPLASAFRLKECRIYAANSGTGVSDAEIIWFSGNTDQEPDESKVRTAQAWQTMPNVTVSRPPRNSLAGFWHRDTVASMTTLVLGLTATVGSVVHLDLDWDLPTGVTASIPITVSTAVVGTFYRLALNRTAGSSTIIPADYNTTT